MEHRPTLICSVLLFVLLQLGQTDAYSSESSIIHKFMSLQVHNRITYPHAAPPPLHFPTEYGRSCSDIGCLSSETCVMAQDSCSYNQRENKDCGRYPTCRKTGAAGAATPGRTMGNFSHEVEGRRRRRRSGQRSRELVCRVSAWDGKYSDAN